LAISWTPFLGAIVAIVILGAGCANDVAEETLATDTTTTASSLPEDVATPPISTVDRDAPTATPVPVPPPTTTTKPSPPAFEYSVEPVTEQTVALTWREECPLHYSELSLLTLTYWNLEGRPVKGKMVINAAVVEDVITAFRDLFAIGFPIERMALVDDYGGDDNEAMAANVTSGFNCRYVDGTEHWSDHAYGLAIDINPLLNPWERDGDVLPVEGTRYTDRGDPVPGMINLGDPIVDILADVGWSWGGVWTSADYMHFSRPGN